MRFQYRVCHNHLKQPWKKGEPLHHQGTCYLSIFRGPIFPCNKVVMVDPVIEPWFVDAWNVQTQLASTTRTDLTFKSWIQLGTDLVATKYNKLELQEGEKHSLYILWFNGCTISNRSYHVTVGTGGSPKNSIVGWSKCNKTPLFTVFSAHTQIASMLMLREHMSCLFATIRRFFMTCVDTFSSQHIETA